MIQDPSRRSLLALGATAVGMGTLIATPTLAKTLMPTYGWDELPQFRGWLPPDPFRTSYLEPGVEGERVALTGRVLTRTGVAAGKVRLEFWHADQAGNYDNNGYRLRGIQNTGADSRFHLETIMPGYHDGQIRRINFLAMAERPGRVQPIFVSAAVFFATDDELKTPVSTADRPYVAPHATMYGEDSAFLAISDLPVSAGVRTAFYDIVLDSD